MKSDVTQNFDKWLRETYIPSLDEHLKTEKELYRKGVPKAFLRNRENMNELTKLKEYDIDHKLNFGTLVSMYMHDTKDFGGYFSLISRYGTKLTILSSR